MTPHPPIEASPTGIPCLEARGGRAILHLRVTAKAANNRLGGVVADADGRHRLRIAVTAPPSDGAANAAVIKSLAKALGLPKSALSIVAGMTDRNKQIEIAGFDGDGQLAARLGALAQDRNPC